MRADRLVAVLLLLQARGRVTAAQIAEELEISERTARRDLDALAMAGVPVYSCRGRGGGWSLVGGAKTDLTGLTAAEAQALLVAANTGGGDSKRGQSDLTAALRKLIQAMPATFRSDAEAVSRSIHVDPNRWAGPPTRAEPEYLEQLQTAVIRGLQIDLGYQSPGREPSMRRVHPFGLVTKASVWYLVAGTTKGQRTFRVSRVQSVASTGEPAERPADFDLAAAWEAITERFGSQMVAQDVTAEATVEGWTIAPIRNLWATKLSVLRRQDDGRFQVRVAAPTIPILAYGFAGLGPAVEVGSPPELLAELGRIGRHLLDRYDQRRS